MTYTPEQISQINLKMNLSPIQKRDLAKSTSSEDTLRSLATDENFWVRFWVADNPNTPEDVLRTLATDDDFWIRKEVENNPNYKPGPYKILELTKVQYDALKQLIDSCKNTDLLIINL